MRRLQIDLCQQVTNQIDLKTAFTQREGRNCFITLKRQNNELNIDRRPSSFKIKREEPKKLESLEKR